MARKMNVPQALELLEQMDREDAPVSSIDDSTDSDTEDETFIPGPESDSDSEEEEEGGVEEDSQDEGMETSPPKIDPSWRSKTGVIWSPQPADDSAHCRPGGSLSSGITRYAVTRIQTIEDSFSFFSSIVKNTNVEGKRSQDSWREVDATEIRSYFGLLILAGVYRSRGEATTSLWGEETGRPIFRATMSLKRFRAITSAMRFDDKLSRPARQRRSPDKLAPLRDIWERWVARLPLGFRPGEDVCVDEQLVSFRGRCGFRQYIPTKPGKYGIKLWVLCDVATSYALRIIPYLGKAPGAPVERGQGKRVVLELTEGLSGHTVTTDNFFTSLELGEELLKKKNFLVGTVRKNKPELPPKLLQTKGRPIFSSLFGFTSTTAAVSYIPARSRSVLLFSTKHRRVEVADEPKQKPEIVLCYNRCKGAVDNLDKLIATYSCRRGTRRWPMSLFGNILDISAYNALVLWLCVDPGWCQRRHDRRRVFLQELGSALVKPAMERRKYLPRTSAAAALVMEQRASEPAQEEQETREKNRCHLCRGKRSVFSRFCTKCGQAVCKDHAKVLCTACAK